MKAATVRAFLDVADDLLAAQQRLMPHPLPEELLALTGAYVAARLALMDARAAKAAASPPESKPTVRRQHPSPQDEHAASPLVTGEPPPTLLMLRRRY